MKPIVLVTLEYPPQHGGVGNYYQQLVRHSNNQIIVLDNHAQQLIRLRTRLFPRWFIGFKSLWLAIKKSSTKHVLVGQVLPLGTVTWMLSYVLPIQYSVFIHGMDSAVPLEYKRKQWLIKQILKRAQYIFTVSNYTASRIQPLLLDTQLHKIQLLPPGPVIGPQLLKLQEVSADFLDIIPNKFFLSVGRLVERKGFDQVIKAMAKLHSRYPDMHYVIAGSGPYKNSLMNLIQEYHLESFIHIIEQGSNQDIAQLYKRCDFFIMPSRIVNQNDFEGFGIVVLEANAFAKPAIGGNVAGMPDAIIHNHTGLLVDPRSLEAITDAMEQFISQPDLTHRLGEQAQQWVTQHHNWQIKTDQFLALLR